jgi:hypothetical protein
MGQNFRPYEILAPSEFVVGITLLQIQLAAEFLHKGHFVLGRARAAWRAREKFSDENLFQGLIKNFPGENFLQIFSGEKI